MKRIASAGIAVAAVAAAIAWGIWLGLPSRAPSPPAKPAVPSGGFRILRVLDGETGGPAAGAWVEFVAKEGFDSGEDSGAAWIQGGAGGIVRIPAASIESKGWESAKVGALDRPTIEIPAETFRALILAEPPNAWISLERGAPLSGQVIDEDGRTIHRARVTVRGSIEDAAGKIHTGLEGRRLGWIFATESDEQGRFQVRLLPEEGAGQPSIEFVKVGYLPASPAMPLAPGAVVTLLEEACVVGFVKDPQNSAIEGAGIEARPEVAEAAPSTMPPSVTVTTSGRDGSFEMRLAARFRYRIAAGSRVYAPSEVGDVRPADGAYLDIVLQPKTELMAPSIRLLAGDPPGPVRDSLVHVFFPILSDERLQHGKTDGEGRIRVVIPPGEVGREIVFVVPDVGFGQLEVLPFEDRDRQEWEVALQGGHNIDVAFVDAAGSPLEGIDVDFTLSTCEEEVLRTLEFQDERNARTDASGRVSFPGLVAGKYGLSLPYDLDLFSAGESDGYNRFRVRIPEHSSLSIRLLPPAQILGKVVDPDGKPLREAYAGIEGYRTLHEKAGEDGRFRMAVFGVPERVETDPDAAARELTLRVHRDGFVQKKVVLPRVPNAGETLDAGTIQLVPFPVLPAARERSGRLIMKLPETSNARSLIRYVSLHRAGGDAGSDWEWVQYTKMRFELGEVCIDELEPGTYKLNAGVRGYLPPHWESEPIPIASGETRTIVPTFERGLDLSGLVIDGETGAPVEGARLFVRQSGIWRQDATNEGGPFLLAGLFPGPGELEVSKDGYSSFYLWFDAAEELREPIPLVRIDGEFGDRAEDPRLAKVQDQPRPIFVPIAIAVERPNGLLLRNEEECAIEVDGIEGSNWLARPYNTGLRLAHVPADPGTRFRFWAGAYFPSEWLEWDKISFETPGALRIRLRERPDGPPTRVAVRRSDGSPVAGARVCTGCGPDSPPCGLTDANGQVSLCPLPPGPVQIRVTHPGFIDESVRHEYDGRGEPISIVVFRPAILECSLRFKEEGLPLRAELGELRNWEVSFSFSSPHSLRIEKIPPGTHELRILWGNRALDCARKTLAFGDGETVSTEIDLPMGSIEGRVSILRGGRADEQIPPHSEIELRPAGSSAAEATSSDIDPNGRYAFRHIPPGRYRVEWAQGPGVRPGRDVDVRDGETAQADLEVKSWSLRGTVVSSDGSRVRRAKASVDHRRPKTRPERAVFNSDSVHDIWPSGRFSIYDVAEGRQTLIVTAAGFVPSRQVIDVDRDRAIDVVLEKGVPVPLTVAGPDGKGPAARAFWRYADGSTGYAGFVKAKGTVFVPSAAVSLRVETESGATIDVPLVKAEGGGFAPVRAVIPSGEGR